MYNHNKCVHIKIIQRNCKFKFNPEYKIQLLQHYLQTLERDA
jgi:hypothetical protein